MHARAATVEAVEPSDGSGDASDDSATIADRLKPIELKRKAKSAAKRKAGDPLARPVLKHPKAGERREGGSDGEVEITGHATAAAAAAHTTSGDEEAPSVPASPTIGQRNQATPRNQPLPAQPSAAFPTRIRAVPEVGSSNAITRVSKVWASGLTPPFGRLLWAARSAVACPGCPWDGAAWHGGCALLPRWWSTPAAPSCRDRGSIPRVGSPRGRASAPPAAGIRPRADAPRRQPADAADTDAATPPPTPPTPTTTTSPPSPPLPSPSPPLPAVENRHCRRRG